MKKKAVYLPTPEGFHTITKLCEKMAKIPVYELYKEEPGIEILKMIYPGHAEFLDLEPEEMVRRHKMGIEAAKVLIIREK